MAHEYSLAMTTVGTMADADRLAAGLVEARLAACVQILPITSHYRWDGEATRSDEFLLLVKAPQPRLDAVREFTVAHHPYEVPEFVEVPVTSGLPAYLTWMDDSTAAT